MMIRLFVLVLLFLLVAPQSVRYGDTVYALTDGGRMFYSRPWNTPPLPREAMHLCSDENGDGEAIPYGSVPYQCLSPRAFLELLESL